MKSKAVLSAADVTSMLNAAEAFATSRQWAVSISVVDDGGHLLGMRRLDGAAPMTAQMSLSKANASALARRETKVFEDMINNGRYAFLSAPTLQGMLEGGVPVLVDGLVIAAVGVSGVKSSEDVEVARAGIAALGL